MARPVKDTPVLEGEDARRFEAWMAENEGKKNFAGCKVKDRACRTEISGI